MNEKQKEIIEELHRVAGLLGINSLSKKQFSQHGNISVAMVQQRFGSWNRAIEAAGMTPTPAQHLHGTPTLSDEILLEEIFRLAKELDKVPTANEMTAFGRFSPAPYSKRWGTFSEAVRVAYEKYELPFPNTEIKSPSKNELSV